MYTREVKIEKLRAAEQRGWDMIDITDPASERMLTLLNNLSTMDHYIDYLEHPEHYSWEPVGRSVVEDIAPESPEAPEAPEAEQPVTPVVEDAKPQMPPDCKPAPAYDKKTVTDMMKDARRKGINVSDIIKAFGVDNLGDIPAEKYPEVVAALEAEEKK